MNKRRETAGAVIAGMLGLSIMSMLWPAAPTLAAPVLAWMALGLLWRDIGIQQRAQAVIFCVVGIVALWWGSGRGAELHVEGILGQNQAILSMLASITLLRLLPPPVAGGRTRASAWCRDLRAQHARGACVRLP